MSPGSAETQIPRARLPILGNFCRAIDAKWTGDRLFSCTKALKLYGLQVLSPGASGLTRAGSAVLILSNFAFFITRQVVLWDAIDGCRHAAVPSHRVIAAQKALLRRKAASPPCSRSDVDEHRVALDLDFIAKVDACRQIPDAGGFVDNRLAIPTSRRAFGVFGSRARDQFP